MSSDDRIKELERTLNRVATELRTSKKEAQDLKLEIESLKASPTWKLGRLAVRSFHAVSGSLLKGQAAKLSSLFRPKPIPEGTGDAHRTMDENRVVRALLRDHAGVMIDVGAHHGGALTAFAKAGWAIHAFEPNPQNAEKLKAAIQDLDGVKLDSRAVSDHDGEMVTLYVSDVSSGISGLLNFHESHRPIGKVETVTLRTYLKEQSVEDVDYLKIDAEGHDYHVLKGFPFDRMRPRVVTCEFEDKKVRGGGPTYRDLASLLLENGYRVLVSEWYPIVEYGVSHRWRCFGVYPHLLHHPDAWGNLIACQRRSDFEALLRIPEVAVGFC